jgi:hypothetical protein
MASYIITIEEKSWKKIKIEDNEPLTEEEREEIIYQGEDGIPNRFLGIVEIIDEGGEYPLSVSIEGD